jgi:hypothetical protein
MIGIYVNFNSTADLKEVEKDLEKLGGYEVCGHDAESPCWKLGEYSVDGEAADFTEEECNSIRKHAEDLLKSLKIDYSVTVSS